MTFTTEQKRAIEQAGQEPVRVEDPETNTTYVLIREGMFRKLSAVTGEFQACEEIDPSFFEIEDFKPARGDSR